MMIVLCPHCYGKTEIVTNGYYCPKCKRIVDLAASISTYEPVEYDKQMWSEKELKDLIKQVIKELEEEK